MIIKAFEDNAKLERCITLANAILNNPSFYMKISQKTHFDMATCEPKYISNFIRNNLDVIECRVYLYYKRFSRANAYFIASKPDCIFINEAKLNRTDGSVVATIIHEYFHMADYLCKEHSFGHGSNSKKGKENTTQYWVGNLAQSMIDGVTNFNNNESSKIYTKKTIWQKIKRFFGRFV